MMTTSIDPVSVDSAAQSAPFADAEIVQNIAGAVGSELGARCVILFGSRARGDHRANSDVDLAVIVHQEDLDAQQRHDLRENAHSAAAAIADGRFRRIDVVIWTDAEFRTKKRSINHVTGRAWREGKILYGTHETLPGEEIVSELDNANELMRMCRGQVRALFAMALEDDVFIENIFGFHAQRGTELALKAWVSLVGEGYERTHNVAELVTILDNVGVTEVRQYAHLASLTPYAVEYVYKEIENPTMDRQYIAGEVNGLAERVESLIRQAEEGATSG